MKVTQVGKLTLVVLTRDEHCPPHVHVEGSDWTARFKFSFWHDAVCLWDVHPKGNRPTAAVLEELRQKLEEPKHLRKARECFWKAVGSVCLENLYYDLANEEVVKPGARTNSIKIASATFNPGKYTTEFQLDDGTKASIEHDDTEDQI